MKDGTARSDQRAVVFSNAVFFVVLLLFCWVVGEGRFFPTVDGPVHGYNARLLGDLLQGDDHSLAFFRFNELPVPYWTSNALMGLLGVLLGPDEVERVVVLLIVVAIALSFRWLLRSMGVGPSLRDTLIFPMIWTVPLQLGFFNFCLGTAAMFFIIGWWMRGTISWTVQRSLLGALLLLGLYFTHLMLFACTLGVIACLEIERSVCQRSTRRMDLTLKTIAFLPALLLAGSYLLLADGEGPKAASMPMAQRLEWLLNGQPLLTLKWDEELPMVRLVQGGLLCLAAAAFVQRTRERQGWHQHDIWLGLSITLAGACLLLPDGFSSGTILLVRLQLFALIFLAIWCAAQRIAAWPRHVGVKAVLTGALMHLHFHRGTVRSLRAEAEDLYSVSSTIGPDATVLPLNYSGNWVHGNFADYLGLYGNTIVLDNFVARFAHAPIRWRQEMEPFNDVGDFACSLTPCVDLEAWTARTGRPMDHVLTVQMPATPEDSCTRDAWRQLNDRYRPVVVSTSGKVCLYALK